MTAARLQRARQVIAEVHLGQQQLVACLPIVVGKCAPIPHFLIARPQCLPQSRFLGLVKKAHLASAINARLVDLSHGVFCQLTGFHCASEHAGERVDIAHDGYGIATFIQAPHLPRLNAFNRYGSERFWVPRSEVPMQFLERVSCCAWPASLNPRRVRVGDEHSKRDAVCSAEAVQRMAAMRYIAEHLLTAFPRLIWLEGVRLSQCDTAIPAKPRVVGPDAARLDPQCEAGKSAA
jgi:hypothetical protein